MYSTRDFANDILQFHALNIFNFLLFLQFETLSCMLVAILNGCLISCGKSFHFKLLTICQKLDLISKSHLHKTKIFEKDSNANIRQ